MEKFVYQPKGTCSKLMEFEIEGNIIKSLKVTGGCNGNLKGIAALVKGMEVQDAITRLQGITCGFKSTSCPDQLAKALEAFL